MWSSGYGGGISHEPPIQLQAMFLTADDIADLTGYVVPAYQIKWLDRNGYPFDVSAGGRPKVLRAYIEQRHGVASASQSVQHVPDFSKWEKIDGR